MNKETVKNETEKTLQSLNSNAICYDSRTQGAAGAISEKIPEFRAILREFDALIEKNTGLACDINLHLNSIQYDIPANDKENITDPEKPENIIHHFRLQMRKLHKLTIQLEHVNNRIKDLA